MRIFADENLMCSTLFGYKFTDDGEYIEKEIAAFGKNTLCLELIPEHITGKRINES